LALASVVDCRACRYDLPNGEDHTSLPSVLRSRDRADQPAPILGRGPAGLQESKRTALHDLDRVDRYRTCGWISAGCSRQSGVLHGWFVGAVRRAGPAGRDPGGQRCV